MIDVQYLNELLNDRVLLESLPKRFKHLERVLDQGKNFETLFIIFLSEIVNVRQRLFDCNFGVTMVLPDPQGEPRHFRKKVYIPENGYHVSFIYLIYFFSRITLVAY